MYSFRETKSYKKYILLEKLKNYKKNILLEKLKNYNEIYSSRDF